MKKMSGRILSFLLALSVILSVSGVTVFADPSESTLGSSVVSTDDHPPLMDLTEENTQTAGRFDAGSESECPDCGGKDGVHTPECRQYQAPADEPGEKPSEAPGTCAECGASGDADGKLVHKETCPLYEAPAPACGCGAVPGEDGTTVHAEDCPLYEAPAPVCDCGAVPGEDGTTVHAEDCPLSVAPGLEGVILSFAALDGAVARQNVPVGTEIEALNLPETVKATLEDAEEESDVPVLWSCENYDPQTEGEYQFASALTGEKLTLASDEVAMPEITVTVGEVWVSVGYQVDELITAPSFRTRSMEVPGSFSGNFGNQLTDNSKQFYNELVNALEAGTLAQGAGTKLVFTGNKTYSAMGTDADDAYRKVSDEISLDFLDAYAAFDRDHPEVFWFGSQIVRGISYGYYPPQQGEPFVFTAETTVTPWHLFSPDYLTYSVVENKPVEVAEDIAAAVALIEQDEEKITKAIDSINSAMTAINPTTDKDKLEFLHDWLTEANRYNTTKPLDNAPHSAWEITSALLSNSAGDGGGDGPVCEGYARAFKVLCDKLTDVSCILASGDGITNSGGSEPHMWNYVRLDGKWYAVDVTWDDPIVGGNDTTGTDTWFLKGSRNFIRHISSGIFMSSTSGVSMQSNAFAYPALSADDYAGPCTCAVVINSFVGGSTGEAEHPFTLSASASITGGCTAHSTAPTANVTYAITKIMDGAEDKTGDPSYAAINGAVLTISRPCTVTVTATATHSDNSGLTDTAEADFTYTTKKVPAADAAVAVDPSTSAVFPYGTALNELTLTGSFKDDTGAALEGSLDWEEPHLTPAVGSTTAKWVFTPDDVNYAQVTGTVSITVTAKTITVKEVKLTGPVMQKTYDGTTGLPAGLTVQVELDGVIGGDAVSVSCVPELESADAGDRHVVAKNLSLTGPDSGNYLLSGTEAVSTGTIAVKQQTIALGSYQFGGTTVTYNGKKQVVTVPTKPDNIGEVRFYNYSDAVSPVLERFEGATDAGAYKLFAHFVPSDPNYDTELVTVTLTINPKELTVSAAFPENYSRPYDGGVWIDPQLIVLSLGGIEEIDKDDVSLVAPVSSASFESMNAGVRKANVTVSGDNLALEGTKKDNYKLPEHFDSTLTTTNTAEITKVPLVPSVAEDSVQDKTYDGTLDAAGTLTLAAQEGGPSIPENETPAATGTFKFTDANAGENKTVNVTGITLGDGWDTNYTLTETSLTGVPTTAQITRAEPSVPAAPTNLSATYGQTLANITLPTPDGGGRWSWADDTASVGNAGTRTHTLIFTPADSANYSTKEVEVTVKVGRASPHVANRPALNATYGQTLADVTISGGNITGVDGNSLPGTWSWSFDGSSVGNVGTNTFLAFFSPEDTENYVGLNAGIEITVVRATPTITVTTDHPSGQRAGKDVVLTVKVAPADDANLAAGQITVSLENAGVKTPLAAVAGQPGTYQGVYTLNGTYAADKEAVFSVTTAESKNLNAQTVPATASVKYLDKYVTTTEITASSETPTYGERVTLTAAVSRGSTAEEKAGAFSGALQFYKGGEPIGTAQTVTLADGETSKSVTLGLTRADLPYSEDAYEFTAKFTPDEAFRIDFAESVSNSASVAVIRRTVNVSIALPEYAQKEYDGTVDFTLPDGTMTSLSGGFATDPLLFAYDGIKLAGADVGDRALSAEGGRLTGSASANYTLGTVTFSRAVKVTPRPLTIVSVKAADRAYNGTKTVAIESITLENVIAADADGVTASADGAEVSSPLAGSYGTARLTGVTLGGVRAGNYSIAATAENAVVDPAVVISKAPAPQMISPAPRTVSYSNTKEQSIPVSEFGIPSDVAGTYSAAIASNENDILASAGMKGGAVVFNLEDSLTTEAIGKTAALTVTFTPAEGTYETASAAVTITVADRTYQSIVVKNAPAAVKLGDELVLPDSFQLTVTYGADDGLEPAVYGRDGVTVTGYDKNATGESSIGVKTITVTAKDDSKATQTFNITVEDWLAGINLTQPAKTTYAWGEDALLDLAGGSVLPIMKSQITQTAVPLTLSMLDKTSGILGTIGRHTITVTYEGWTQSFTITVDAPTPPAVTPGEEPEAGKPGAIVPEDALPPSVSPGDTLTLQISAPENERLGDEAAANDTLKNLNISMYNAKLLKNGTDEVEPDGTITLVLPLPAGAKAGDSFTVMLWDDAAGNFQTLSASVKDGMLHVRTDTLGDLVIGYKEHTGSVSSGGGGGGSSSSGSFDAEEFWDNVIRKIKKAGDGDVVKAGASRLENVPVRVLKALDGRNVTLVITHGKYEIVINGENMKEIPGNRLFYLFKDLAELYPDGAVDTETGETLSGRPYNPVTGGGYFPGVTVPTETVELTSIKADPANIGPVREAYQPAPDKSGNLIAPDGSTVTPEGIIVKSAQRPPLAAVAVIVAAFGVFGIMAYRAVKRRKMEI